MGHFKIKCSVTTNDDLMVFKLAVLSIAFNAVDPKHLKDL